MTSIQPAQDFVDQVSGIATCNLLAAGTAVAANVAVASVYTGQVWGVVGGGVGTAAFAALGVATGCYNNPDNPQGTGPPIGCSKTDKGVNLNWETISATPTGNNIATNIVEILEVYEGTDSFGYPIWIVKAQRETGGVGDFPGPRRIMEPLRIFLDTEGTDAQCLSEGDPNLPISPPFVYTDPDTQCEWTIEPLDAFIGADGLPHVLWKATASDPACGGPFTWWDSPTDGPVPVGPNPFAPDENPPPPELPHNPIDYSDDFTDIKERLERIENCACHVHPSPEGEFRTISFRSDQTSPYGKSRLRKRFRYRSLSGLGLSEVVDHWRNFTFEAGPVCVIHSGGSWGTPQVWASTADEGKRVIRHAAAEAGFDPDQDGKWTVSGSSSARVGVSGTMRVDTKGGYYWITSRDGSNQRPTVALT